MTADSKLGNRIEELSLKYLTAKEQLGKSQEEYLTCLKELEALSIHLDYERTIQPENLEQKIAATPELQHLTDRDTVKFKGILLLKTDYEGLQQLCSNYMRTPEEWQPEHISIENKRLTRFVSKLYTHNKMHIPETLTQLQYLDCNNNQLTPESKNQLKALRTKGIKVIL